MCKTVDGHFPCKMLVITVRTTPSQIAPQQKSHNLPTLQTYCNRPTAFCTPPHPNPSTKTAWKTYRTRHIDVLRWTANDKLPQEKRHASQHGMVGWGMVGTEQKLLVNPTCFLQLFQKKVLNSNWQGLITLDTLLTFVCWDVLQVGSSLFTALSATQGVRFANSWPTPRARNKRLTHSGLEFLLAAYVPTDSCTFPRRLGPHLSCYPPLSHGSSRFTHVHDIFYGQLRG